MIEHFKNIEYLYGKKASIQMPNGIFRELSACIKNSSEHANSQQVSFAYAYLVAIAFLYKYTHFVDLDNGTYIQNSDLKELLGYSKQTKSINSIIAKGGILEMMGLVETTKDFPVRFYLDTDNKEEGYPKREFVTIKDIDEKDVQYDKIKKTVKNRNYEIREPLFLTGSAERVPTLTHFENTHKITIKEFIAFLEDNTMNNLDLMVYAYLKSRCQGMAGRSAAIALQKILDDIGMDNRSYYRHLSVLKERGYISVFHGRWKTRKNDNFIRMVPNRYHWKGVS